MAFGYNHEFVPPRELEHPLFPITETGTKIMMWTQEQPMRPAYELWAGEFVVATLRYRGIAKDGALGASTDGLWSIVESPGASNTISILERGQVYGTLRTSGGLTDTLVLSNKRKFHWVLRDLWRKDRAFVDHKGQILLVCKPESGQKARTRVLLSPGAMHCSELSFLTIVAQYMMLGRSKQNSINLAAIPGGLAAR